MQLLFYQVKYCNVNMLNVKAFDPARSALMCAMTYVNILPHVWWVTVMSKCSHIMLKKKVCSPFCAYVSCTGKEQD